MEETSTGREVGANIAALTGLALVATAIISKSALETMETPGNNAADTGLIFLGSLVTNTMFAAIPAVLLSRVQGGLGEAHGELVETLLSKGDDHAPYNGLARAVGLTVLTAGVAALGIGAEKVFEIVPPLFDPAVGPGGPVQRLLEDISNGSVKADLALTGAAVVGLAVEEASLAARKLTTLLTRDDKAPLSILHS